MPALLDRIIDHLVEQRRPVIVLIPNPKVDAFDCRVKFEVWFPPFLIRSDDDYLISVCRKPVSLVRQHPLHPRGPIRACYVV